MARVARQKSKTGVYHVMVRGINRENIFLDDEDRLRYLATLKRFKRQASLRLFGFCLMRNHVHLLLAEGEEPLGETMRRLGSSYVPWYNDKYLRVGHLFQDRFLSEPVEDDAYFQAALRYIHQNPVQAKLVDACNGYPWSSYGAYAGLAPCLPGLVDTDLILGMHGSVQRFVEFTGSPGTMALSDLEQPNRVSDTALRGKLDSLLLQKQLGSLSEASRPDRAEILRQLKAMDGVTLRQITRVTGLSKSTVGNA